MPKVLITGVAGFLGSHLADRFIKEVLALVNNPKAHIIHKPLPVDDPKVRKPDITKVRAVLGWEPKVDRAEGLRRTYEYFKKTIKVN